MLVFESQTPQDLLKEIAEFLRLRGGQEGLISHPVWRGRTTTAARNLASARENILKQIAADLETATVQPKVDLNAAALKLYNRPYAELDADKQAELKEESEDWGPNGPATCDLFE